MFLSDIKGHGLILKQLLGAASRERLASSYLFAGEEGIGKRESAIALVRAINCMNPTEHDGRMDACGKCSYCVKQASGSHPDYMFVEPDGADIKVAQIRLVEEMLAFRAFEARYKVVIVNDAHRMNISAANAFLKTLEEPAEYTVLILISSMPDMLPITIRSRCVKVNFKPLNPSDCEAILKDVAGGAATLARLSMGRPGLARADDLLGGRDGFLDTLDKMLSGETKPTWKDRSDIEGWLDMALMLLRDMAHHKVTGTTGGMINEDIADEVGQMGRGLELEKLLEYYDKLRALRSTLLFNLNKGITWNYAGELMGELKIHG
jgi:DNA polymerase-3 subunit delta'